MSNVAPAKICVVCGIDCSTITRLKDPQGNYYCQPCHQTLTASPPPPPPPPASSSPGLFLQTDHPPTHGEPAVHPHARSVAAPPRSQRSRRGSESFMQSALGTATVVLGAFILMLVLAKISSAFSLLYVGGAVVFFVGFWIAVVVFAFRTSIGQGLLTLFVPLYGFYFIYGLSERPRLKALAPLTLGVWFGMFLLPGTAIEVSDAAIQPAAAKANSENVWHYNDASYQVAQVIATQEQFFGKPGMMVRFFDEPVRPEDPVFRKNRAEIFFPENGGSYGKPISVAFRPASGSQVQESKTTGFDGELTSVDADKKTVSGWVRISGVGPNGGGSIDARFEGVIAANN